MDSIDLDDAALPSVHRPSPPSREVRIAEKLKTEGTASVSGVFEHPGTGRCRLVEAEIQPEKEKILSLSWPGACPLRLPELYPPSPGGI